MLKNDVLTFIEWITYAVIIALAINAIGVGVRWWYLQGVYPGDFILYYNAAHEIYGEGWLYKEIIAKFFKFFLKITGTYDDPFTGYMYWSGFQTMCWLLIAHLMFKVKYGFIFIWATLKLFTDLLQVGNIQILCCLAAFSPFTSLLGGVVKPHYFAFSIGHAVISRYKFRIGERDGTNKVRKSGISSTNLLHDKKK